MTTTADRTEAEPGDLRLPAPARPIRLPALDRPIRLIATDLDGTLLLHHRSVTARAVAAIDAATAAGVPVVVATGRQVPQVPPLIQPAAIRHIVGSNGSIAVDLHTGQVLFESLLPPATLAAVVEALSAAAPGVRFSAVRDHGRRHATEPGYLDLLGPGERDTGWQFDLAPLPEVIGEPTLKLVARHHVITPEELLELLNASGLDGFHATTSGAPFLEIANAGVTKASGLARLCALLEIDPDQVAAFGDARNDLEMLAWAGVGVAMGNAIPEVVAATDWQTASSDEDGVARGIELFLAQGALPRPADLGTD